MSAVGEVRIGLLGLGTGALCTLGYEHGLPILVHWNESVS